MRTSLGTENEEAILKELAPIIKKYAKKTKHSEEHVQSSVAYLWEDNKRDHEERFRDWMSANEIGIFGGR
jgi:hypothetical protein